MKKLALIVLAFQIASGTAIAQTQGSAEAYAIIAANRRQAMEHRMNRNAAKKLCNDQDVRGFEPYSEENSITPSGFKPGLVGRIDYCLFTALQVVPSKEMILLKWGKHTVALAGYTGNQVTDDDHVVVLGYVRVGKKPLTYETASGGSNTVATFTWVSKEESSAIMKKRAEEKKLAEFPEWTSRTGSKVRAKFIRYAAAKVQMQTIDGRELKLKVTDFAEEDQAKIRDLIKASKK